MTSKQVLAAWLVLGLIAMNLFFTSQGSTLWGLIDGTSRSSSGNKKVAGVKNGKHIQVPIGVR